MWTNEVNAQSGLTPSEYNALVAAVETTTPTSASLAPPVGSFYTVTHGESWPPLPADTLGLDFWSLGGNYYLLDDRSYNYSATHAYSGLEWPSPTNGGTGGGDESGPDITLQVFTTNDLWLQITNLVGSNATLLIHPPSGVTNGVYEVLYTTNLNQPIQWQWLLRTDPGQTNLTVSIGTNAGTFYALGKPNDFVANDSLGTNFWLMFPGMHFDGSNALSIYISSSVGATGTLTIANQTNGSTLTVTGDSTVNGTYTLTNVTVIPAFYQDALGQPFNGATCTNAYVNGSLIVFYDNDYADGAGWVLADSGSFTILLTGLYGVPDLNEVTWYYLDDPQPAVHASCAEYPLTQSFSIGAFGTTNIAISNKIMFANYEIIQGEYGINVTANAPISVYAIDYDPQGTAAFTAYPKTLLGTNYCVLARPSDDLPDFGLSEVAILATEDSTHVLIIPSSTASLSGHTSDFWTNLDEGETYEVSSSYYIYDVTGTLVQSDKPIAVFAGDTSARVPDASTGFANPLMQEQIPVDDWGTNYLALSFAGRTGGDSYRVLPMQDGTIIYTNGTAAATNDAGMAFDHIIAGGVQFTANKPIQVAHFSNGATFDNLANTNGDPSETLLLSTDHYLETNIVFSFGTNSEDFHQNYINIVVPQPAITNTVLDGTSIASSNFVSVGSNGYFGARISVANAAGPHIIISSQPIGVEVYGSGGFDAYAYIGGLVK